MAKIYNSDVTKGLATNAGIQQNVDKTPNELAEKIVPTFETNPILLKFTEFSDYRSYTATLGSSVTMKTTSSIKRTFLTAASIAIVKDAANDKSTGAFFITVTPKGGASTRILVVPVLVTTAQDVRDTIYFNPPLELEKNTTIEIPSFSYAAGTASFTAGFKGFELESSA